MIKARKKICIFSLVAALLFSLTACVKNRSEEGGKNKTSSDSLYVTKVENLTDDFILGMDVSSLISLENSGVKYYNFNDEEEDLLKILSDNGINYIRVRVWNDPYDAEGNGYGGGNCDINTAVEIGKRATKYGMKLLVDFHYSDFWADPSKQMVPKAWESLKSTEKENALYTYTVESLNKLKDAGVDVGMVQIGNETNGSFCGESKWKNICPLMSAGSRAIREVFPSALIAVHFANPEKITNYPSYAQNLKYYGVDYDVFGSSYYPYWHGTLENLQEVLNGITTKYGKKVMVMETSYSFTSEDSDYFGNTISDGGSIVKNYPFTVQGQANCVRDVVNAVANMDEGIGVCYWEGAWISVNQASYEENQVLWEKYGSGWASSYAKDYDPDDAGKYYGGSAVDNQTFFDQNGKPLESLKVFGMLKYGNDIATKADAIEDTNLIIDLNGKIELPSQVNAVMTDNSKQAIDVTWKNVDYDAMYAGGVAKYDIIGEAGGMEAHCYVSMVEFNFLDNYSFETDDNGKRVPTGWNMEESGSANELWVEEKSTDSLTGDKHYHFWSGTTDTVDFNLYQEVSTLDTGTYKFTISIMGGDAGTTDIYMYVLVNGAEVSRKALTISSYGNWDTEVINGISVTKGDTVTVGIRVKCSGSGNGAWGKIDDALLNSEA